MTKIDLPKRSGKSSKVREKSVKSQGILQTILSGNPALSIVNYGFSKHYAGSMVSDRCPLGYLFLK